MWRRTGDLGREINRANPVAEAVVGGLRMGPGGRGEACEQSAVQTGRSSPPNVQGRPGDTVASERCGSREPQVRYWSARELMVVVAVTGPGIVSCSNSVELPFAPLIMTQSPSQSHKTGSVCRWQRGVRLGVHEHFRRRRVV